MAEMIAEKDIRHQTKAFPDGFNFEVKAGAAAATNIAITGIKTGDKLMMVLQVEPDNGVIATMLTDRTSEASISSDGNIQLSTAVTTGKQLLIFWYDRT